jgi:hypothetical protein
MTHQRNESEELAVQQVAILFPYLSPAERYDWWEQLSNICSLTELTAHIPNFEERLAAAQQARAKEDTP